MKNARTMPLLILTCFFVIAVLGLFIAKTRNHTPVHIQKLPSVTISTASSEIKVRSVERKPVLVNINTVTSGQLQSLPGIGQTLAERIVAYRNAYGSFESVGELMLVDGIGKTKLEAIWDLVTVGG